MCFPWDGKQAQPVRSFLRRITHLSRVNPLLLLFTTLNENPTDPKYRVRVRVRARVRVREWVCVSVKVRVRIRDLEFGLVFYGFG